MFRFGIAALLALVAIAAIGFAVLKPFTPNITIFEPVYTRALHGYDKDAVRYELTVANTGSMPIWMPENSESYFGYWVGSQVLISDMRETWVNIAFEETPPRKIEPGEGLVYDLFVRRRYETFKVHVSVRDRLGKEVIVEKAVVVIGHPGG